MTAPVIQLSQLDKRYGAIRALDRLTLDVEPGPVGLLGPNGAGKTTLIKLLLGLLRPSGGSARIAGFDPTDKKERLAIRRAVGYLPEGDCLVPGMTGVELVTTMGRLTGMGYQDAMTRAHEVLDYVGLDEARYRGSDEYSTGMKQRLKLAQSLVHDPELLLLDEPTNGLDPKGRRHMLELVHDLGHRQGKNLLLCSHLLPDVERTCEHVVVIHRGKMLVAGSIAEMTRSDETWLRVEVAGEAAAFAGGLEREGFAFVPEGDLCFRVRLNGADDGSGYGSDDGSEHGDRLFGLAAESGTALTSLAPVTASLEEVFLDALAEAEKAG